MEPTARQWKELHEAARGIKAMAPWDSLRDQDFITIQLPGRDEPVFCSVMGGGGGCYGIGMYPGNEAAARLLRMAHAPEGEPPFIHALMQTCVNCYYGDREDLAVAERATLKGLGIKYRGHNQWVYFRSHKEGCPPQPIGREEAALAIDVLQNLYMALRAYLEGRLKVDFEKGETLYRWRDEKKEGQWCCAAMPWPEQFHFAMDAITVSNEEFLAEMNAAKKTGSVLELDLFYLPFPMREKEGGLERCPRRFLAADAESGLVLGQKTLDWGDEPEDAMLDFLEDWIGENGRPARINMRSVFTGMLLYDFCQKTGIDLQMEGIPVLDKLIGEMTGFIGGISRGDFR